MKCMNCPPLVWLSRLLLAVLLSAAGLMGQQAPAVDLLRDEDIPLARRILVAPIALFQQVSYATPLLNCQFAPSCSHFMALSISRHGVAKGTIMGADRLVRCNPFAYGYQLRDRRSPFHDDGRLLDPVPATGEPGALRHGLAGAIIPGLGRVRAGRPGDGLVSFLLVTSLATSAIGMQAEGQDLRAGLVGTVALLFWLGDVYGSAVLKRNSNIE